MEKKRQEQLNEDSKTWPTYLNYQLGIAFKFPPVTAEGEMVFVQAGKILFLTNSSSPIFVHRNELTHLKSEREIIARAKKLTSSQTESWMIETREVHSPGDLEKFIQDRFEESFRNGCRLGSLHESMQGEVFDVEVTPVKPSDDPPSSSCWINWMMPFKYSYQFSRAAMWDIGQEARFYPKLQQPCPEHSECDESTADEIIADSFRFIPSDPKGETIVVQPEK